MRTKREKSRRSSFVSRSGRRVGQLLDRCLNVE